MFFEVIGTIYRLREYYMITINTFHSYRTFHMKGFFLKILTHLIHYLILILKEHLVGIPCGKLFLQ